MYRLCFALMMFADLAGAATIVNTSVTCDGVTTSALNCNTGEAMAHIEASPFFVEVDVSADRGDHSAFASVSLQAEVAITIISGPATGFFWPCITGIADNFNATANASYTIGGYNGGAGGPGFSDTSNCTPSFESGLQPYTLGVTQILPVSATASASGGGQIGPAPDGSAQAFLAFLQVYDSAGTIDNNAVYKLTAFPESPEPTPDVLVFCGVLLLCVARRGLAWVHGAA